MFKRNLIVLKAKLINSISSLVIPMLDITKFMHVCIQNQNKN